MVDLLDQAASAFGMCRTDVIRRSLSRDLAFVTSHEIPQTYKRVAAGQSAYARWIKRNHEVI